MAIELPVKVKVDGIPETQAAFNNLGRSWDLTKMAAVSLTSAIGGMAVIGGITKLFISARKEAQEYNTLQLQLKTSLGYTSGALNAQAAALGKQLHIHDEEISRVQLLISNYAKNEDQIRRLTPAVLDLAAALGIDVNSAAQIVARSISGSSDQIGRYKIHIKGAADSSERIDSIIGALNNRFKGQAEAIAENKDWWEKLTLSISETTKAAYNLFLHYDKVKKQSEAEATIAMIGYYKNILKHEKDYNEVVIENSKKRLAELYKSPEGEALRKASFDKTMEANMKAAADQRRITDKLQKELWQLTDEGKIKLLQKEQRDELANTKLTGEQRKLVEQRYAIEIAEIRKNINKKEEEKPVKIAEGDLPWYVDPKYMEAMAEQAREREELLKVSEDNLANLEEAATNSQYAKKMKQIKREHDNEEKELKKFLKLKTITQKQYDDAMAANDRLTQQMRNDAMMSSAQQALSTVTSGLQQIASKHKEFTGLYKSMAITQATIDTYKSAESVYAGFSTIPIIGQALGIIGAAAAIAAGLANVQQIASAKMAYGGVVTGGTPGRDSVPAMLMPGEIVYNPAHPNPVLSSMITNTDNSNSSHNYQISMPITIQGNPTSTMVAKIGEVSQRAVLSALKRAQNMGKISATGLTIRH